MRSVWWVKDPLGFPAQGPFASRKAALKAAHRAAQDDPDRGICPVRRNGDGASWTLAGVVRQYRVFEEKDDGYWRETPLLDVFPLGDVEDGYAGEFEE